MEFRNLTPYPAIAFDGLDQHDQRFHVVVMRLTFELQDDGTLLLASGQTPLVTTDAYYGEANRSSVRQESDLAPYKPHTDVIVIADAHAPQGKPRPRFRVALSIHGAPSAPELPPAPHGLNPGMHASAERMAAWRQECARVTAQAAAGVVVLRKVLQVCGTREWRKRSVATRTLSLFTLARWKLTSPAPASTVPVRYEFAYGGENKVLASDPAARRVHKQYRLAQQEAIAHTVYDQNPVGRGFAERWFLHATQAKIVVAPQIELPDQPIALVGCNDAPQGFGIVGRSWQPRAALAGTYDRQWLEQRHPHLPVDFDFAYWNGAPADQQVTPYLQGDEQIGLVNLCPAGPATRCDAGGNIRLTFALPGHLPFVLVRFEDGRIGELAAKLDTLLIDAAPEAGDPARKVSVVCVWRATVPTEPAVRVLEARMLSRADVAAMRNKTASRPDLTIVPN